MGSKIIRMFCKLFGHNFRYNFPSLPNKCICKRCNLKMQFDVFTLEWKIVDSFPKTLGTEAELKKRWH